MYAIIKKDADWCGGQINLVAGIYSNKKAAESCNGLYNGEVTFVKKVYQINSDCRYTMALTREDAETLAKFTREVVNAETDQTRCICNPSQLSDEWLAHPWEQKEKPFAEKLYAYMLSAIGNIIGESIEISGATYEVENTSLVINGDYDMIIIADAISDGKSYKICFKNPFDKMDWSNPTYVDLVDDDEEDDELYR